MKNIRKIEDQTTERGYRHIMMLVELKGLEVYIGILMYDGKILSKHTAWSEGGIRTEIQRSKTAIAA